MGENFDSLKGVHKKRLSKMSPEEWQAEIEEENRLREEKEYKIYLSFGRAKPFSEKEFNDIVDTSHKRYLKAQEENKVGYCFEYDFYWSDINDAAKKVNPGEWYRVWLGHYPRFVDKYGHSAKWVRQADYYVNKALACGIAKTAEEAVQYFKDNK